MSSKSVPGPRARQEARKILWFARGGAIARMGPYLSQVAAAASLRLAQDVNGCPAYPADAFVWPEEEKPYA